MNLKEVITLLNRLDIAKEHYCVVGSGALAIHGVEGIYPNDIDILVDDQGYSALLRHGYRPQKKVGSTNEQLTDEIEIKRVSKLDSQIINGYPTQKWDSLLEYYKTAAEGNNPKRIAKLEADKRKYNLMLATKK